VPELNETYHSKHGAIQESNHIFIEAGLKDLQRKESLTNPLHILEIGFGTGLNAFLTHLAASNFAVNYSSLEAYPLNKEITSALNYSDILAVSEPDKKIFEVMHESAWNEVIEVRPNFHLTKLHQKLEEAVLPPNHFHLVYYDAFAPEVQPELWTEEVFAKIYAAMQENGVLTTYCAKGVVKRALKKVGFEGGGLPGPPGKREITKATKVLK
ncbi:MAG: tRNA (5-methylaminomethyl-2-thiouridine)(34)-methyltransferase MnmD, partial [Chitinophagales bacterium]